MPKGEREFGVRGGLLSNWGDDDADDKATIWCGEGCGDGQWTLYVQGYSRDVSTWGVQDDSDQEKKILSQLMQGGYQSGMLLRKGGWRCLFFLW